ncbi:hypothetical protein BJX64DRAFT_269152 [Aspergillus heterothallicus]
MWTVNYVDHEPMYRFCCSIPVISRAVESLSEASSFPVRRYLPGSKPSPRPRSCIPKS